MKKIGRSILVLAGVFFSWSVLADGVLTPIHGGRMVEAEGSRLELVVTGDKVDLYVSDHGNKPITVAGASGKVLFLTGGKKVEVPLQSAGSNLLTGTAKIPDGEKIAAVMTVEGLPKRITARLPAHH